MLSKPILACPHCGTHFRQIKAQKFCKPSCRKAHHYHQKAKFKHGEPVGTEKACAECGAHFVKRHKRQHYCGSCSEMSREGTLPAYRDWNRRYMAKYQRERRASSPQWTIHSRMSAGIKNSLRDGKCGRSWETLVGFTVSALMLHLERQFLPGMTWGNRGDWHVDHIRPLCSFTFQTPEDPQFREAWALTNLQPLWAADNIRKGGRVVLLP